MDLVRRGFTLVVLSVVALSFLLIAPVARAAEYGNIGGKPARPREDNARSQSIFIHELDPGQTVEDAIEVVNYTNVTKTLLVYATDSIVSSGGAFGCAQKVDEIKDVGGWIALTKNEVTLKSGQTEIIPFTITAPSFRPQVGENNGCIVVQEKNAATQDIEQDGGSIAISFRTAIRVAIWIPGDIKKSLRILGYAASRADDNSLVDPLNI